MQCCEMVRRSVLKRWVVEYLGTVAPGFIRHLNKLCINIYRVDCLDLLLDDPAKLRDLLLKYNKPEVVEFIVKNLLLKPILKKINKEHLEKTLVKTFMEDLEQFKKLVKDVVELEQ
jgi:hypothetical protein